MNERRHEVIIYWNGEDKAFSAGMPELPGCVADGKTCKEVLANVEVIIGDLRETARELGRPIPQPRSRLLYA